MSKPKKLYQQAQMFSLVEQWQNSSQSRKQFCLEYSTSIPLFTGNKNTKKTKRK